MIGRDSHREWPVIGVLGYALDFKLANFIVETPGYADIVDSANTVALNTSGCTRDVTKGPTIEND